MFNVLRPLFVKYNELGLFIMRKLSTEPVVAMTNLTRSDKISSAIKFYVSKCGERDKLIARERKEYEFGRRFLAKMMGADPETFSQNDIDESIRYLFPSGLFSQKARPIMTDPSNIYPRKKPLQCDNLGRPNNTFYYTGKPVYHSIVHEAVYILEKLKSMEDVNIRGQEQLAAKIDLHSSRWMNSQEFANHCLEKIPDFLYQNWVNLMDSIYKHKFNSEAKQFLMLMRVSIKKLENMENMPEPVIDPETGKRYVETYGQKKWTLAEVRLFMPGDGKFTINNKSLLDIVPLITNRECILFPLQFTDTIGKVDVVATCSISGSSCVALSLRLAIARALSAFLPETEVARMRLAGLLTQDERYKERKRPGQPKARKKAPWRKR